MVEMLERLRRKRAYYENAPAWVLSLWPAFDGFEWFCKHNRSELQKLGAIRKLGRDWFIDAEAFPGAVATVYGLPAAVAAEAASLEGAQA